MGTSTFSLAAHLCPGIGHTFKIKLLMGGLLSISHPLPKRAIFP